MTNNLCFQETQLKNSSLKLATLLSIGIAPSSYAQSQELEKAPKPPKIEAKEPAEIKRQAGIGSEFAFAEAGVLEVGGSFNYSHTDDLSTAGISPFIGYFLSDNFQLSALTNFTYAKPDGEDSTNSGSLIIEPSIHHPLSNTTFVFGGLGIGAYFAQDVETGAAIAPRLGYKQLVGRSGMITLAVQPVFAASSEDREEGTLVTVEDGVNIDIGFSVLL